MGWQIATPSLSYPVLRSNEPATAHSISIADFCQLKLTCGDELHLLNQASQTPSTILQPVLEPLIL